MSVSIMFAAPEYYPFTDDGPAARAASSLPKALAAAGCQVIVAIPKKRPLHDPVESAGSIAVSEAGISVDVTVEKAKETDVPVYFLGGPGIEGHSDPYGASVFCRAVAGLSKLLNFSPDIYHCNDWYCALLPLLVDESVSGRKAASILSIRDFENQGQFPLDKLSELGLGDIDDDAIAWNGKGNLLALGTRFADCISTASPSFSEEVVGDGFHFGLGPLLSERKPIHGILDGLDPALWNPQRDFRIYQRYGPEFLGDKGENKVCLQADVGLDPDGARPVLAMVGKFTKNSGVETLISAVPQLTETAHVIVMGTGDERFEKDLSMAMNMYPGISVLLKDDESMVRKILAGADMLIIPSRAEPSNQTSLAGLRYGTVPIASNTGIHSDILREVSALSGTGNGFLFKPKSKESLLEAFKSAMEVFHDRESWESVMLRGMTMDFSWDEAARDYLGLYRIITSE